MSKQKKAFIKYLKDKDIKKKVLDAFEAVDQEDFFTETLKGGLYTEKPVPIGCGEMSDDPFVLAKMIQVLDPKKSWKILEVGTGSGYSTAILSSMVKEVVTVEFHEPLAQLAKEKLIDKGYFNIRIFAGDATQMHDRLGPFDGIIIHPACSHRPLTLLSMLKGSRFSVFPMGPTFQQQIVRYKNALLGAEDTLKNFTFYDFCRAESIRGRYGWRDQEEGFLTDKLPDDERIKHIDEEEKKEDKSGKKKESKAKSKKKK